MAAHKSDLMSGGIRSIRLRLTNITIAITVVIGVMKRNHNAKISTRLRWGQNGTWRSIGNEKRKATKPSKEGKHHRRGSQALSWRRAVCSDSVTLNPSTNSILAVLGGEKLMRSLSVFTNASSGVALDAGHKCGSLSRLMC
jgi:hypothetical protein